MQGEAEGGPLGLTGFLSAVAVIYGAGVKLRRKAYDKGWLKTRRLGCAVISVGNLTLGGTGKTPMTVYLAKRLRSQGYRVAVVTRGYKGAAQKRGGVVSDGKRVLMNASACGDEALMMARSLENTPVLVGRNRYAVGQMALDAFRPQVILLDDAFQHIRLERDLDLVLLDAVKPFGNGKLFPRGTLREGTAALNRSSAIVMTRAGQDGPAGGAAVQKIAPGKPLFRCSHHPVITRVVPADRGYGGSHPSPASPGGMRIISNRCGYLFSGIADNGRFERTVAQAGNRICGASFFEDHHRYSRTELERIMYAAVDSGADMLLTTEKDFSRIAPGTGWSLDLVVVDVEIRFPDDAFDRYLENTLKEKAKG